MQQSRQVQTIEMALLLVIGKLNREGIKYTMEEEQTLKNILIQYTMEQLNSNTIELFSKTRAMSSLSDDFIAWCGAFFTLYRCNGAVAQLALLSRSGLNYIESAPLIIGGLYAKEAGGTSEYVRNRMHCSAQPMHPFTHYAMDKLGRENRKLHHRYIHVGLDMQILPRLTLMRYIGETWNVPMIKTLWYNDTRGFLEKLNANSTATMSNASTNNHMSEHTRLMFIVMRALILLKKTDSIASIILLPQKKSEYDLYKFEIYKPFQSHDTSSLLGTLTEARIVCFLWRICILSKTQDLHDMKSLRLNKWGEILKLPYAEDILNLLLLYGNSHIINFNVIDHIIRDKEITAENFKKYADILFQFGKSITLDSLIYNIELDNQKRYILLELMIHWGRHIEATTLEMYVRTLPNHIQPNRSSNQPNLNEVVHTRMVTLLCQTIGATLPQYKKHTQQLKHYRDSYVSAINMLSTKNYTLLLRATLIHLPYTWKMKIKRQLYNDLDELSNLQEVLSECAGDDENTFLENFNKYNDADLVHEYRMLPNLKSIHTIRALRSNTRIFPQNTTNTSQLLAPIREDIERVYNEYNKSCNISLQMPSFCSKATKYVELVSKCHKEFDGTLNTITKTDTEKHGVKRGREHG